MGNHQFVSPLCSHLTSPPAPAPHPLLQNKNASEGRSTGTKAFGSRSLSWSPGTCTSRPPPRCTSAHRSSLQWVLRMDRCLGHMFYSSASCGLVVERPTWLLKLKVVLPFQRQPSLSLPFAHQPDAILRNIFRWRWCMIAPN